MFDTLRFMSAEDIFLVPICLLMFYALVRFRAKRQQDAQVEKLYYRAFYFKVLCVFAYTFITEFYFSGGDTGLYYQGVKDLRTALNDDFDYIGDIITSLSLDDKNPLAPYFMYDGYSYDMTFNYMRAPANFYMPRIGLIPSLLFFNSYLCIAITLAMFAMAGCLRLFKVFYHFYPHLRKELALAILFLPSVGFWSSGLLKDTICFGCLGFFVYGFFNVFIRKRNFIGSIIWMAIAGYFLYVIKTYIFLVIVMALVIWLFAETNKVIKERTLRRIFAFLTFTVGLGVGFFLFQYFTAQETLKQYQLENIISTAEYQRSNYEFIDQMQENQSSYYTVDASNPVSLVLNSIVATFFRPFPWEVKNVAALLSALEALGFMLLTIHIFLKGGLIRTFKNIFQDPRIFMCFIFAIVFAIGVGASTANFGALSRYKIPCLPFYMVMLLLLYNNSGIPYPAWFKWLLNKLK